MIRSVLSVIVGFIVATAIMMFTEFTNGRVLNPGYAELAAAKDQEAVEQARKDAPNGRPDEKTVLMRRREAVREVLANAPVGALLVVIVGWTLGSVGGGFAAARISAKSPLAHCVVLGVLLTLAGIANNLMIPPPLWFWVATLLVFIPGAAIGAAISARLRTLPEPR